MSERMDESTTDYTV